MLCPRCNQDNPDGARFCNACGAALDQGTPPEDLHLDLLHRYISRPLADKMRALGGRIEGERRHVTVMFADLSGFTAMSERLDPEDVTLVMNACFKELVEVVFKYEGTIDKFIGDEIMALFGVPIAHENDPERAVRAALEMQERLKEFNRSVNVSLPKPLTMHVGINSGEVIVGNVGSDLRMDYSVLGDTVNLAARLEAASASGQIFVSDRTYALTRHVFDFRRLKPFKVQGKRKKVQVYEVQGVKRIPESGRGVQAGYGPLIDREGEVEILREMVEAVRQGQGRVIGLVGEAGIGKSRLVYELRQMTDGFTVASGACTSYEAPPAYQVFTDVMRGLLRIEADDPEGVIRQRIETWVAAHELDAEVIPYVGSLFALRDERLLYLQDEERYQGVREAVLSVLRAVTANGPLLIALEDLHWIDPSSRRLLNDLVGQASSLSLLLCCVYRPEFQHEWEGIPGYQTLLIEPLSREQTVALSESIVKLDLPPELEHAILSRAEGNPFFVEEMLKALMDEGVIAKTRTGYALQKDISEIHLPATMQGVIMARIDRLEAQARETLQVASVIGRRFSEMLLKAVSPRAQRVERDLEQLQGLDLVYQHSLLPDLEYIFKHFVTREVAYNSILVKRRKAIHLETARAMERIYRERLEEYYEALAHHFEAGEEWQKAADYFGKAGTKAREVHSDAGATAFLERRDQAVQKVFEQKEGVSRGRQIGIVVSAVLVSLPLFLVLLQLTFGLLKKLTFKYGPLISPDLADSFLGFLWKLYYGVRPWSIAVQKSAFSTVWSYPSSLFYAVLMLFVGYALIKLVRTRVADSVTIYTDRIMIRSPKEFTQIPFGSITSVQRLRRLRLWYAFKQIFRKQRVIYGTSRLGTEFRNTYFGSANVLKISRGSDVPIVLDSLNSGDLYREIKLSMMKWASTQGRDMAGMLFEGSPSRFEEQYNLPLRQMDGTTLPFATYDQLIERIERGEVHESDEVALKGERVEKEAWVSLKTAAREDLRLWSALHPLWQSAKACYHNPVIWMLSVWALIVMGDGVYQRFQEWQVLHWGFVIASVLEFIIRTIVFGIPLVFSVYGIYLRFGLLEWAKRYTLSRRQRIGVRVFTGIAAVAAIYGLFRVIAVSRDITAPISQTIEYLAIPPEIRDAEWAYKKGRFEEAIAGFEAAREKVQMPQIYLRLCASYSFLSHYDDWERAVSEGLNRYPKNESLRWQMIGLSTIYEKQGAHQKIVKMLGPPAYSFIQQHRETISPIKYEAAMNVLNRMVREKTEYPPETIQLWVGWFFAEMFETLAVSIARTGDVEGGRAIIEAITDNVFHDPQRYFFPYILYGGLAECYLMDHTILPDGAGLAEFEKAVSDKDRGVALLQLGYQLKPKSEEAALGAFRRALDFLEPNSAYKQDAQHAMCWSLIEVFLKDHTILPDGTGLVEFEKNFPERDRGKALFELGFRLLGPPTPNWGAALAAFRRTLNFVEPNSNTGWAARDMIKKLQSARRDSAARR